MTNTETSSKSPTHRVYPVTKGKAEKRYWSEIGAAWANPTARAFNVKLDYLPLNGAGIVIREPRAKQAPAEAD